MHAPPCILSSVAICHTVTSQLRADGAWADIQGAPEDMGAFNLAFIELGAISPRFAARLVHAGVLSALANVAASHPGHCGSSTAALTGRAGRGCLAAFKCHVPQVRPPKHVLRL